MQSSSTLKSQTRTAVKSPIQPLSPLRQWLDNLEINDAKVAHRIARLIPGQCPFERDVTVWGHTLF
ncbi:MAG: Mo-dependent nitrogenase C-terminal domain-containing protein, partial [Leptolyngbyaceae cyanobacterium]